MPILLPAVKTFAADMADKNAGSCLPKLRRLCVRRGKHMATPRSTRVPIPLLIQTSGAWPDGHRMRLI